MGRSGRHGGTAEGADRPLASSGPPELSADAAELAVQYRVLAAADDIDGAWERVGDPATAAFRRVESYADSHCESGGVT